MSVHIFNKGKPTGPWIKRKIQCPANYLLNPKCDIWVREPVPELKGCSDFVYLKEKKINIKKTRIKTDRFGFKVLDRKKMREYEKQGLLIKPFISASEAIEKIYDPLSPICVYYCKKQCLRGKGKILTRTINRLSGKPCKEGRRHNG